MNIKLKPEDEQLIQKLQSGFFRTVEEVIHDALTSQDAEEAWLQEHREAINAKIARGLDQLDSGKGFPGTRCVLACRRERPLGGLSVSVRERYVPLPGERTIMAIQQVGGKRLMLGDAEHEAF